MHNRNLALCLFLKRRIQGCGGVSVAKTPLLLLVLAATPSWGAVGDPVGAPIAPDPAIGSQFCSIGLAFDGSLLYFNRCSDPNIYAISAEDGSLQEDRSLLEEENPQSWRIPELPAAMAFDAKRGGAIGLASGGCSPEDGGDAPPEM